VPRRGKPEVPSQNAPAWHDPAGWALWRLSLVLKEISETAIPGAEREKPPNQAPAEDSLAGKDGECENGN
jgi:hypothetical protein